LKTISVRQDFCLKVPFIILMRSKFKTSQYQGKYHSSIIVACMYILWRSSRTIIWSKGRANHYGTLMNNSTKLPFRSKTSTFIDISMNKKAQDTNNPGGICKTWDWAELDIFLPGLSFWKHSEGMQNHLSLDSKSPEHKLQRRWWLNTSSSLLFQISWLHLRVGFSLHGSTLGMSPGICRLLLNTTKASCITCREAYVLILPVESVWVFTIFFMWGGGTIGCTTRLTLNTLKHFGIKFILQGFCVLNFELCFSWVSKMVFPQCW